MMDLTPTQLADRLAQSAERVAERLLPNGKREGREWCAGSVAGEAGKSLKVCVAGGKAGRWKDFAADHGGDLLDLWAATRGITLREAMDEARAYLGLPAAGLERAKPKQYTRPERPKCGVPNGPVLEYLQHRGILKETARAFSIGERGDQIIFPFLRDGELVMAKARKAADGESPKPTAANCEQCAFGWQAVRGDARELVITEGEIDAMSVYQMGWSAVSVPYGGGGGEKQAWVENDFERLMAFDVIYLCLDNDAPGQEACAELVKRLGRERCRIVELPGVKDANEYLTRGFTGEDFEGCLRAAKTLDPDELRQASMYRDDVLRFMFEQQAEEGIELPWQALSGIRLRPGDTVLIGGINGHGKSDVVNNIVPHAIQQGYRCCVASLEYRPAKWLSRVVHVTAGVSEGIARDYAEACIDWLGESLWMFDPGRGKSKVERLVDTMIYAARRYQIDLFIIDNLAKCGIAEDDYAGQKQFIDDLSDLCRQYQFCVVLVVHLRKPENENAKTDKMSVKGSGGLTDLVDTVMFIRRNKAKEKALREAKLKGQDAPEEARKPDAFLTVEKERDRGDEPAAALWHTPCCQFIDYAREPVRKYVQMSKEAAA